MADGTIDNLQIVVTAETKKAESALKNLVKTLEPFKKFASEMGSASGIDKMVDTNGIKNGTSALRKMSEEAAKVSKQYKVTVGSYKQLIAMSKKLKSNSGKITDDYGITEAVNRYMDARKAKMSGNGINTGGMSVPFDWEKFNAKAKRQRAEIQKAMFDSTLDSMFAKPTAAMKKQFNDILKSAGKETSQSDILESLIKNAEQLDTVEKPLASITAKFGELKAKAKGAAKSIKDLGKQMSKSFKNSVLGETIGKVAGSLERILRYRTVNEFLKQIAKAFSEGVKNLYQYSKAMGTDFASSMDNAATSLQYFRNSVGAMAAPILNALIPVFDSLIDRIVEGVNWLNQLVAKMTGASSWTKAIRKETQFAEATKDAADATKRLIAGFDELNIVSSTGKSTAGSSSADYSGMFTEMPIESATQSAVTWAEKLLDIWEKIKEYSNEIIAGFAAFNISKLFGGDLKTSATLAISVAGFTLEFDAIKNLASGEGTKDDIVKAILGALVGIAGLTVKFGVAGLVIGLAASAAVAVVSWKTTMDSKARSEYENSEFYQQILKLREGDEKRIKIKEEIEIDFANAEQSIKDINDKVAITKELLEQAFTLNGKENRTLTETEQLKAIIDQINALGVVELDFDGTSITNAKEEVYKLLDATEKVMLVEAYKENLKTYYKDLAEATIAYNDATDSLDAATELYTGKQEELFNKLGNVIKKKLDITEPADLAGGKLSELTEYVYKFGDSLTGVTRDEINLYRTALSDATEEIDIAKEHQQYFGDTIEKIKGKINDASEAIIDYGNEFKKLDGLSAEMTVDIRYTKEQARDKTDKILANLGLPGFASGGFPTVGQLFVARETGPELVGTMGGRSAVANNAQIIGGIQAGVTSAMTNVLRSSNASGEDTSEQNRLLREQNTLLRRIADKELSITPSAALGRVVKRSQKLADNVTGG